MSENTTATPVTVVVHSTPGFTNNALFFRVLDENLARWNITRVIAEQGSAVATMAAYWCELHQIKLAIVVQNLLVARIEDRPRRYQQIVYEEPDMALFFNQPRHWVKLATALHDAGTKVCFVYPRGHQPNYVPWSPHMTRMPPALDDFDAARDVRKGRPRKVLTPEERAARKKEATARSDEKRRLLKSMSRPMRVSAITRRRKERKSAITRHG